MRIPVIVYALVMAWACAFAWSFIATSGVEGPRNIDTGFKRLDVLFRGQMIALGLAVVAAAAGFLVGAPGKRDRIIGLLPLMFTVLIVAGIAVFAILHQPPRPENTAPTRPVTAPAMELQDGG